MTTLDYALAYIRRGWSIIPLLPKSKAPACPIADHLSGAKRLTETHARIWWEQHPDCGIGIVTGKPSGIVVIDVDPRNGGDPAAIKDIPPVHIQGTGGGGMHAICEYPADGEVRCGKTSKLGIDRKADGGYIVAAPSIHPSGMAYYWLVDDVRDWHAGMTLPPLPAWVVERRQSEMLASGDTDPWIAEALAHPEDVRPGTQEQTLTRLCWWAAGHMEYDIAHALMCTWAQRLPLGNPHQPWTDADVESRLDRAFENREPDAGYITGIVDDMAPARKAALRDKVRTAPEFIAQATLDEASRTWIATDFVAPGCFTEVLGVMKEGKTTFVCGLVDAIILGQPYLERACNPTSVLYVSEQVGLSLQRTLERGGLTQAERLYILTIADIFGMDWKDTGPSIVEIASELGCGVIVIDTLHRLAGIQEEDEASSVTFLNPLLGARAKGIAVIFVRHSRKSGGAINVAGRGSGAITGEMDVCLYITAPEGVKSDYRHLEGVSRLTDTIELHLAYEDGRYVIGDDPATAAREHKHAALVQYLSAQGMRFTPWSEVANAVAEQTKKSTKTIGRYLVELVEAGRVEKTDDGYRIKPEPVVTGVTA